MTEPQKYIFDESFNSAAAVVDPIAELRLEFEEKLSQAKAESFERGLREGEEKANKTIKADTKTALEKLSHTEESLREDFQKLAERLEAQAIEFGITTGTKLAGNLLERQPIEALHEFFKEALSVLQTVPALRAKVHPDLIESARAAQEEWAADAGWEGTLVFAKDETLGISDAKISFEDGGISRSVNEMIEAIAIALQNHSENFNLANEKKVSQIRETEQIANQQPPEDTAEIPAPQSPLNETIERSEHSS